ncbi:protein phosphatase 2C domain-containing protein [[Pseudomonas] carboxydohydrogena]|jgi:protein phosphatase|uniref:Protein phosphatase 2C domain-containing protein n=1 Tax=Afipia carboxydohydrogena TaxID=290 RepID=A0ABY8BNX1_AFICR|nr:protein phosphatase 2C domain-containing protein [[Pseudomonas] carboxydohydrogena]WEF51680.1 protein phosphatase 2C domain-containing protein [[Pseudomonas] carboxydohydrogena]
MSWSVAAFTHRGLVRSSNEDAMAIAGQLLTGDMDHVHHRHVDGGNCLLMVADGMGGHTHGALASRTVLDHLIANADELLEPEGAAAAVDAANARLYTVMAERPESEEMGTTLVGAVLFAGSLLVFNVGDSRCYRGREGALCQLSLDDVANTAKDASGHRQSHAITQCLGGVPFQLPLSPHIAVHPPLAVGETLLLCSDGLADMVDDEAISHLLTDAAGGVTEVVRKLARAAMKAGGADNLSIIAMRSDLYSSPIAQKDL